MLRSLGYQARVVMGFRTGRYDPAVGGYRLDGSTVDVRTEVHFAGLGWVPFPVTPSTRADGSAPPPEEAEQPADDDGDIAEQENARPQPVPTVPPPPRSAPPTAPAADSGPSPVRLAVLVLAALLVVLLLVPVAKAVRRLRRRRRGDPVRRIAGAWAETVDRLAEAGVPVDAGRTTGELAAEAAARAEGSRIAVLARLRDASYAPEPPSHCEADAAWTAADDVGKRLRRGRSPARRARARLDPRPLLRR